MAEIRPGEPQPLRIVNQHRFMGDLAAVIADEEAHRLAVSGHRELRSAAVRIELGIAEGADQAVVLPEDLEVKGEAVVERDNGAAPFIAGAGQRKRCREGLARRAGIGTVTVR